MSEGPGVGAVGGARLLGCRGALREQHDSVLLDLDGVVYIGPDVVAGAAEALDEVRSKGVALRFVTNNASRPPETVAEHLTRLGVPTVREEVVTSAQVAAALLAHRFPAGARVLVIGGAGLVQALTAQGLVPVDSVDDSPVAVVQGFDPDLGWRRLAEASRAVRDGLFWMATNLDRTVPTPYGPAPGNGSLVGIVATAAGREPDDVAGKPRPGAFREAAATAGSTAPLVVGDRLDTDLEGGRAAEMPGLLVLTGLTGVSELLAAPPHRRPDYVGRDLWALTVSHPPAGADRTSAGAEGESSIVRGSCADAVVTVDDAGDVRIVCAGEDALDLLRAATVAVWGALDARPGLVVDPRPVIDAVRAAEPGAQWAR